MDSSILGLPLLNEGKPPALSENSMMQLIASSLKTYDPDLTVKKPVRDIVTLSHQFNWPNSAKDEVREQREKERAHIYARDELKLPPFLGGLKQGMKPNF